MSRPKVKIAVKRTDYNGILSLSASVQAGLTTNITLFPLPSPPVATLLLDATTLSTAIAAWGTVHNRGTHAQYLAMRNAANVVYNDLVAEAAYVQSVIDPTESYVDQATDISLSGFSVKNSPAPQGRLAAPENVHQMFSPGVSIYTPKIKFKKPLGLTSPGNVKLYTIFRGLLTTHPIAIATTTKTSFIDTTPLTIGTVYKYQVAAVNTNGIGALSTELHITVPL